MISKRHVRAIWGAPALIFLFNWAVYSNFGMNNVTPSVNIQCYMKKQTQSLPSDNNGCFVFHDYIWCPKHVLVAAEKNLSRSWEFCEHKTDSILVLNLGTSCSNYTEYFILPKSQYASKSLVITIQINQRNSHSNGFFTNTWEIRKIQAEHIIQILFFPNNLQRLQL